MNRELVARAVQDVSSQLRMDIEQQPRDQAISGPLQLQVEKERGKELVETWIEHYRQHCVRQGITRLSKDDEAEIERHVLDRLFALGDLQQYLDDPDVETIYVNGCDVAFVQRAGGWRTRVDPIADSDEELIADINRWAAREGLGERRFDRSSPVLDLTLRDRSRLVAVMDVCRRPSVTIARQRLPHVGLDGLVGLRMMPPELADVIRASVLAEFALVISGPTGAGKSTLLQSCGAVLPPSTRIITIEDTFELLFDLDIERHPNCVALLTREANLEGVGAITADDLLKASLRMRPDVIIVGEMRGREVLTMCDAVDGGTGSLSTCHANSARATIPRLKRLMASAPNPLDGPDRAELIAATLDLIIHVKRSTVGGQLHRWVDEVWEIGDDADGGVVPRNVIFENGELRMDRMSDERREKLEAAGCASTGWRRERRLG